jgi:hypothetical protein
MLSTVKILCPEELGDDNGPTGGDPDYKCNQGEDNGEGCPHGSQRFLAQEAAYDDLVHKGIKLLEHMSKQHGGGKLQDAPAFTTLGKVFHC